MRPISGCPPRMVRQRMKVIQFVRSGRDIAPGLICRIPGATSGSLSRRGTVYYARLTLRRSSAMDLATGSGIPSDSIQPMKSGPSPNALRSWSESLSPISATAYLEIVFPRRSRMGFPSSSVRKPASSHEFPTNRISLPQTLVNAVNDFMVVFLLPVAEAAPTSLRRPVAAHSSAWYIFCFTHYRRQVSQTKNIIADFLKVDKPR